MSSSRPPAPFRRTEEDLLDFVDNGAVGLHWVGADGTILWANKADYELLGYQANEYVGRNIAEFHVDAPVIADFLKRLVAGETLNNCEARLRCKDGSILHALVTSSARFDKDGRFLHTRCFTRDISDRKEVERELRVSQKALALLSSISRSLAEASFDVQKIFELLAQRTAESMGDVCGIRTLSDDRKSLILRASFHVDPEIRKAGEALIGQQDPADDGLAGQVFRTGQPILLPVVPKHELLATYRSPQLRAFVETFSVGSLVVVPLRANGQVFGTMAVSRRLGEGAHAQADVELLQEIADRGAFAVLAARQHLELDRNLNEANRAKERLALLARASDLLSRSLDYEQTLNTVVDLAIPSLGDFGFFDVDLGNGEARRIPRASDPERQKILEGSRWVRSDRTDVNLCALSSGAPALHADIGEAWLKNVAASPEHLEVMRRLAFGSMITVPLTYEQRTLGALTLFFHSPGRQHTEADVQLAHELARRAAAAVENARLYKEAHDAIGLRDDFLSMAGHELRTPLTALQLQLTSIVRAAREGKELTSISDRAERASRNLVRFSTLVNELLDISRIRGGKLTLERARFELSELIGEILGRMQDELARAGCEVKVAAAKLVVNWDPLRIEQILTNLISNAMKYGKGAPIELGVETVSGNARLTVRDHGIGISPEDQARIFQPFERAAPSRHFGGLGLGLWIVRQLVDAHGGSISVSSQANQGATFTVELPISPP